MSDKKYLQITTTLGYQITFPLFGPVGTGLAFDGNQIGGFVTTPLAPDDFLVSQLKLANAISNAQGMGNLIDPEKLDLWDQLNGTSLSMQMFAGPTIGSYVGTIQDLSSFYPDGSINPSLTLEGTTGGINVSVVVPSAGWDGDGLAPGSGITIGFGPGVGIGYAPSATFVVPLVDADGTPLEGFEFLSANDRLAEFLTQSSIERLPTFDELMAEEASLIPTLSFLGHA